MSTYTVTHNTGQVEQTKFNRLEVFTLASGTRYVRPAHTSGTCGWFPRSWQIAPVPRNTDPLVAFLDANPNWRGLVLVI